MTQCPNCGSHDLETLRELRGERFNPPGMFLIQNFRCRKCGHDFKTAESYGLEAPEE
jgi:transposase-like protein